MPALEMAQETGTLVSWRKKEGESVTKGETLLEVETDKAVMEIEAPADGILAGIKAQQGAVIPVGQTIAWIVRPGEVPPPDAPPGSSARTVSGAARPVSTSHSVGQPDVLGGRMSPKARRLAREGGMDATRLRGSGPGGAIIAADILEAAAKNDTPKVQLSAIARLMAERTTQSWTTVPHFFVSRDLDATMLLQTRQRLSPSVQEKHGIKLSHTDLLIAAVAQALRKYPKINASWTGTSIESHAGINISLAIALEEGVVAAVIPDADNLLLGEIATRRQDLTERARANRLRPADISGGTFTISNLGMFDINSFQAIITPPQAAILAVGRIADRVVPIAGRAEIRPMVNVTLSCDHRVIHGAQAAVFLGQLAAELEALSELSV
jgi:pyruvate dehydrogenase E2 component (dihydrolipoamide acetyltransferase)